MIYLDHNAITPVRPEARAAVLAALDAFGIKNRKPKTIV